VTGTRRDAAHALLSISVQAAYSPSRSGAARVGVELETLTVADQALQNTPDDRRSADRELAAHALAGSDAAWDRILSEHYEEAYKLAYSLTRNVPLAEDLLHTTFLKVRQSLSQYRGECGLELLSRLVENPSSTTSGSDQGITSRELKADEVGDREHLVAAGAAASEAELPAHQIAVRTALLAQVALLTRGALVDGLGDQ
jgi:hypothetical protein